MGVMIILVLGLVFFVLQLWTLFATPSSARGAKVQPNIGLS